MSINNDTVYSIAQVDISGGPVRLDVPDTAGRYYVLQFVDAWTNNFAYIGHRATGTDPASFLLVASDWEDRAPDGVTLIHLPTTVASIVGRWAVDGAADMRNVRALQAALKLTAIADGTSKGLPAPDPGVAPEIAFFEQLRVALEAFPPAQRDLEYQRRFAPLGLLDTESPYRRPDTALAVALTEGLAQGKQQMEHLLTHGTSPEVNGWSLTYHAFDYNLDFFEVGTLDDDQWKITDPKLRYIERALAARGGLWGNHGYEAAYAMSYKDGNGDVLDGTRSYELVFQTTPPVGAFWSVTMYSTPDFYLVDNPIDRYSIGDRTPGLTHGPDGSLTIVMQPAQPDDPAKRANWLPTPPGPFRPILRMYEPDAAVFDGSYQLPPIVPA